MSNSSQHLPSQRPIYLSLLTIPFLLALDIALLGSPPLSRAAHAAELNGDCTLIVPDKPLTAKGLAIPYQLVATNPTKGACHEANPRQSAFVQGVIINPATGQIWIYNPLVVDQGTQPAIQPRPPFGGTIPPGDIVALWFGTNSATLTLQGTPGSLQDARCVTGGPDGSPFGQFAHCNALAFFLAANRAIQAGTLVPPPLGMAKDGMVCPTVRDFSLVDQDQSDGVTTTYRVTASGLMEQDTHANAKSSPGQTIANESDNSLLVEVDKALGCTPWMEPDLADPGKSLPALPLNELQADMLQGEPMALPPNRDAMALVNGQPSLAKLNAYRVGVDQPQERDSQQSNTTVYCRHLVSIAPARLQADAQWLSKQSSPDPATADSLLTFLAARFVTTYGQTGLDCIDKIKPTQPSPITVQTDMNGVAVQASKNGVPLGGAQVPPTSTPVAQGTNQSKTQAMSFDCVLNGHLVAGCHGTTTMGGQTCAVELYANTRQVTITCK